MATEKEYRRMVLKHSIEVILTLMLSCVISVAVGFHISGFFGLAVALILMIPINKILQFMYCLLRERRTYNYDRITMNGAKVEGRFVIITSRCHIQICDEGRNTTYYFEKWKKVKQKKKRALPWQSTEMKSLMNLSNDNSVHYVARDGIRWSIAHASHPEGDYVFIQNEKANDTDVEFKISIALSVSRKCKGW